MSDFSVSQAFFALPDAGRLIVSGAEAGPFLQRQSMNDVRQLVQDGDWQWNGILSAKGRVLSLFLLLRRASDEFWIITLAGEGVDLFEALSRFVLRSKVGLAPDDSTTMAGWLGDEPRLADHRVVNRADCVGINLGNAAAPRSLWWGSGAERIGCLADARRLRWSALDIAFGVPVLAADQRDAYTPQMLSLERLQAFSLKKGCYPGQEIVARTHYLGQSKRALHRLCSSAEFKPGDPIFHREHRLGQALSAVATDAGWEGLAVLSEVNAEIDLRDANRASLRRLPFLGS